MEEIKFKVKMKEADGTVTTTEITLSSDNEVSGKVIDPEEE